MFEPPATFAAAGLRAGYDAPVKLLLGGGFLVCLASASLIYLTTHGGIGRGLGWAFGVTLVVGLGMMAAETLNQLIDPD